MADHSEASHNVGMDTKPGPLLSHAAAPDVDASSLPASTTSTTATTAASSAAVSQQQEPPPLSSVFPKVPIAAENGGPAGVPTSAALPIPDQLYSPSGRKRKQRTSGVWRYFEQFTPVAPKGRNVRCMVMVEGPPDPATGLPRTVRCGATYTHVESRPGNGGSGTSGMLHHLFKKHPVIHSEIMRATPSKLRKSEASASPVAGKDATTSSSGSSAGGGGGRGFPQPRPPSSPGTALAQLRAGGLGSDARPPPMTAEESIPHDRRLVLMCALQTVDPASVRSSLGFRLFVNQLSPAYAAGRCMVRRQPPGIATTSAEEAPVASAAAVNAILADLCGAVRREVIAALKAQSDSCRRLGWSGPFVGLQVDSTCTAGGAAAGVHSGGEGEVCIASVSFVPPDFGGLVRLAIGARCFRGGQASDEKEGWLRELTADLFTSVCGKSEPRDIYLAATVGGWSSVEYHGGNSFRRALEEMGVPVLVCSSYRLNSAVLCSLGGGDNEVTCANSKMRDVVRRAVSMVEVFEHWRPSGGAYATAASSAPLETVRAEVDELAVALARTRGSNARWTEYHALFERLLQLVGPLNAHFQGNPSDRSLEPSEWHAIREAASILEPALEVVAKVHAQDEVQEGEGGQGVDGDGQAGVYNGDRGVRAAVSPGGKSTPREVFLAESIELHANLHCSFIYPLQDIRKTSEGEVAAMGERPATAADSTLPGDAATPFCSKRVADLTPEAQALLKAVAQGMEESGLGRAREDTEAMSMLLDPRFKQCCASTCVDGGNALKLRALTAVSSHLSKFKGPSENGGGRDDESGRGGGSTSPQQEAGGAEAAVSRLDKMRQAQKMEAAAAAVAGGGGGGSPPFAGKKDSNGGGGDHRLSEDALAELGEYMLEPAGKRHELLSYWKLHGTDTRDSGTGQVVLAARWPHLSLLARLYAGVDSTSRQGERHFRDGTGTELGVAVSLLQRNGMPPWRIEQMLLVSMNRHIVPEVVDFRRSGGRL